MKMDNFLMEEKEKGKEDLSKMIMDLMMVMYESIDKIQRKEIEKE